MVDLVTQFNNEWERERPDLDIRPMDVMGRILLLSKKLENAAVTTLKPFDLMFTELHVLASLRRVGKPYQLNPKKLIEYVSITSGSMTACLDKLEKRQLIARVVDPNDKRGRLVGLTDKGFKLIEEAIEVWFVKVKSMTSDLNNSEQQNLAKLLKKLSGIDELTN
jgi:DNA-binding MarR family transcriptional regulator